MKILQKINDIGVRQLDKRWPRASSWCERHGWLILAVAVTEAALFSIMYWKGLL